MLPPQSQYEDSAVAEAESRERVEEPPRYKVLLHNDDYTTMEFVVWVLTQVFNMAEDQAFAVMLNVHVKGIGVAGVFPYDIAETKVHLVTEFAREHDMPLRCSLRKQPN